MKELLEASIVVAKRLRHPHVTPDHVAAAIAEHDDWWRRRIAPVVRPELQRLIEEELASIAIAGTYRDNAVSTRLTPETEELFVPSKWLRKEVTLLLVMKRLERKKTFFREAMLGVRGLDAELRAAVEVAKARKHAAGVRVEHVLWVLSERAWFQRALDMLGGDRDRFTRAVDTRLDGLERGAMWTTLSEEVSGMATQCRLHSSSSTIDAVLELALMNPRTQQLFEAAHVSVPALQALVTDGILRK